MKKFFLAVICLYLLPIYIHAQGKDYKVVFDITTQDTANQQKVLRWAAAIAKDYPESQVEIVFYGHSLDLVTKNKSVNEATVAKLAASKNVTFSVCQVAMKKHNVEAGSLIPGVTTVPDGIYEIVKKEQAGWGYIKVTD